MISAGASRRGNRAFTEVQELNTLILEPLNAVYRLTRGLNGFKVARRGLDIPVFGILLRLHQ